MGVAPIVKSVPPLGAGLVKVLGVLLLAPKLKGTWLLAGKGSDPPAGDAGWLEPKVNGVGTVGVGGWSNENGALNVAGLLGAEAVATNAEGEAAAAFELDVLKLKGAPLGAAEGPKLNAVVDEVGVGMSVIVLFPPKENIVKLDPPKAKGLSSMGFSCEGVVKTFDGAWAASNENVGLSLTGVKKVLDVGVEPKLKEGVAFAGAAAIAGPKLNPRVGLFSVVFASPLVCISRVGLSSILHSRSISLGGVVGRTYIIKLFV